jgi:membrane protein DedA with SNARE-associated domain
MCYCVMMLDTESIILSFSYAGIFGLMVINGFGPFVSSQVLYIIVGYFISTGTLLLFPASVIGAIGNTIGNILLYEAVRRHGVLYLERFKVFNIKDIKKIEIVFRKRGWWFLFVGKLLPAIKVFVPIPAAIGKFDRRGFALIMFSASWVWSLIFITIGYMFGKSAQLWKSYGIILFVIALIVVFLFYRTMNSKEVLKELE